MDPAAGAVSRPDLLRQPVSYFEPGDRSLAPACGSAGERLDVNQSQKMPNRTE
jgi:hypothetical protein